MTKHLLLLILPLLLVSGCGKKSESAAMAPPATRAAPDKTPAYLAYEHSISLDVAEKKVATTFAAAQAACQAAARELCAVLESRLESGRGSNAFLKLRAKPGGIKQIIAKLGQHGDITGQSTSAEDLAAPIADAAKKLTMLKDYRAKLEALGGRATNDVDALIKINRELAQVQSELEASQGAHAHLIERVETEILKITIQSASHQAFWQPIGFAMADFGGNLSHGISSVITGLAYLLPWLIVLLFFTWGGRKLWRRWKRPAPHQ